MTPLLGLTRARAAKGLPAVLLAMGFQACAVDAVDRQPLVGTWDVTQVAVDRADQSHWLYVPDDPRLLGRELRISSAELAINTGALPCQAPQWTNTSESLQRLVGKSFSRPATPGKPTQPTLTDFGLPGPEKTVTVHVATCAKQAQPWDEAWFAVMAEDRLLMRHGSGALLSLARRSNQAKPAASYDCGRAGIDAERTICGSFALAAFDRSVAAAYKRARSIDSEDRTTLRSEQADWLDTRNACGKDSSCLARTMRERVEELMQD